MTFGEHLEELRRCLFRALWGLLGGLVIGLAVGGYVVQFIQTPLEGALRVHYKEVAKDKYAKLADQATQTDGAVPWKSDEVAQSIEKQNILPEVIYLEPKEFLDELQRFGLKVERTSPPGVKPDPAQAAAPAAASPETKADAEANPDEEKKPAGNETREAVKKDEMMRLFFWHRVEDDKRIRATALSTHEVFMIWLKASLLVGVVLSSPWIFYQLWSFVAAGLYPHEKRYVNLYLPFSIGLFLFGAAVAFFGAFPLILHFLFQFNRSMGVDIDPRISEWLSFVLMLPLGFGVAFQLPLVMLFLERIGICTVQSYISYWRVAVLVIFVAAAILTPPDPWSMSLLAIPLTILYFGGILLCKYLPRGPGLLPQDNI